MKENPVYRNNFIDAENLVYLNYFQFFKYFLLRTTQILNSIDAVSVNKIL